MRLPLLSGSTTIRRVDNGLMQNLVDAEPLVNFECWPLELFIDSKFSFSRHNIRSNLIIHERALDA